jgi:TonB-linked SusC/RagA family outer membrane protein
VQQILRFVCLKMPVATTFYFFTAYKPKLRNMRKLVLILCGILLWAGQLAAQTRTVSGKITDASGNPVPNASVSVKGTRAGTTTNVSGDYTLVLPPGAQALVVSGIGMTTQEIPITAAGTYNVSLQQESRGLQEVVVTGYQTRRKKDEAGAISSVSGKTIENLPNPSLDKALQGRAAGVLVQANNGIPGGAINVRIRGTGSFLAGTQPLYVVDGVQLNIRNDASFTQSNPLSFLNPNDIESIDILKDAASAAIYGAQASNGVVIVTTKKGRAGKTRFQFNAYWGQATPIQKLEVMNSQEIFQLRAEATAFNSTASVLPSPGDLSVKRSVLNEFRIPGATTFTDKQADSAIAALPTYDWQDEAFRTASVQNYELSASGGNDRTTFRLSGSYSFQEAIITKADFTRGTLKFDLSNKATDKITINTSLNLSTFNQNVPFATDGSFLGSPAFSSALIYPFNPIYNPDGTYAGVPPANLVGILNQNVIAVNDFNIGNNRTNQVIGNIGLDWKLTPWLTYRPFFGLDYRLVQGKLYRDPRTPDGFNRKGLGQVQSSWNTNFLTTQTLNFLFNITDKHKIDGLLAYEYRAEDQESIATSAEGFPTFQFTTLNTAATPLSASEFYTGYRRQSIFGSVNYNYDGKYILSGILRYDGSSRFGKDYRYGWFPSIRGAWNIDNESFMADAYWVNTLRARASWGVTGNDQIGNFDGLGLYGSAAPYNGNAGITFSQLENPELRWERNQTLNLGVDFGFFKNRINGSVEVYNKLTTDLLLSQPVQYTSGFASITRNVGEIENRGIELTLGFQPVKSNLADGFNWNTQFIFTYNKNSVKKLYFDPVTQTDLQELPGDPSTRVGRELGSVFTQRYAGVNPATGRPMWYDIDGDVIYTVQNQDRVYIGDQQPNYFGGFTNTFTYKGFTLDIFFNYEYGRWAQDGQVNFMLENIARFNGLTEVWNNRWTTPGQITSFPRMRTSGAEPKGSGALSGDRTWFRADYIRLKNVTLSYDIMPDITRRLKLNSARFYITGTNLWTYADWFSYDIEFFGPATGIIPQSRNFTFGVQLGF